jgi:broad specificity phosphatase PhoE
MRLYVLARHAETTLNHQNRINGDTLVPADLTESGRTQAQLLGQEVSALPIDLYVHTRFGRTRVTAELALEGRNIAGLEEPLLDDVDVGELEGWTLDEYRAWKRAHARSEPFPGGESLDDAARRYAGGFRKLLDRSEQVILVVTHEIPIRYALNAAARSEDLDAPVHAIPNARPYLFDDSSLERAASGIEASARLS